MAKRELQQYIASICEFIDQTLQAEGYNNHERLTQVCGLILDLTNLYKGDMILKQKLQQPFVERLLNELNNHPAQDSKETAT